jgi:hypothetical protein
LITAHKKLFPTLSSRRLHFKIVLWTSVDPWNERQVSVPDEPRRQRAMSIIVDDVGCLLTAPGLNVAVLGTTSYVVANGALPIVSREPWQ